MDYKTILTPAVTELEIKKSRFIGQVYPVETENEIEEILIQLRKTHYKATHVCYAYVLGATDTFPERQKASDDGEPSGTAGKPILEVLNHHALKNVLVVVIRYFGGIKLGAGGLIRAYSGTASDAVRQADIILRQLCDPVIIEIDYTLYGGLISLLNNEGHPPVSEDFGEKIALTFHLPVDETASFIDGIREFTNDRFEYYIGEPLMTDRPYQNPLSHG